MRIAKIIAVLFAVAFLFALALWLKPPVLPIDSANGVYSNGLGSSMTLRDGVLSVGDQSTGYTVETDKVGPYVIADQEVVLYPDGNVEIASGQGVLKMYLDRVPQPSSITVYGLRNEPHQFSRQGASEAGE